MDHALSKSPNYYQEALNEYKMQYVIKRIDEDDILIDRETRDKMLQAMASGTRFVQVREYTLMINSIKSIEPRWGEPNVAPEPFLKPKTTWEISAGIKHTQGELNEYKQKCLAFESVFNLKTAPLDSLIYGKLLE